MKTSRSWTAGGICVLIFLSQPLFAQDGSRGNNAPPAEKLAVSPGGVDMRSGRYVYEQTDLSAGGEDGGLTLTRSAVQQVAGHTNPFANFSHNWDILLTEKRVNILENNFVHNPGQPDYQIEIAFGALSQSFRGYGSQSGFELVSRSGYGMLNYTGTRSSPSVVYTYTAADGTEAIFRPFGTGDCSTVLRCAYVSQITAANGARLAFEYDNPGGPNLTRLRSIVSNRGYAMLFEYSGVLITRTCVLNLTLTTKPANNVCPGNALATANYSYATVGSATRMASATDPAGAMWSFTGTTNTIGFVRPGDGGPWLTNTFFPRMNSDGLIEEIVTAQAFADGSSYSYSFAESPPVYCQNPQVVQSVAGGTYTDHLGRSTTVEYAFPYLPFGPSQGHGDVAECDETDPPTLYVHQVTPGPVRIVDPLGRETITDYCDPNAMANLPANWVHRCFVMPMAVSSTDPEGIHTDRVWDMATRNLLLSTQIAEPGSGLANIVTSATYNCTPATIRICDKPVTATNARGNVIDYSYSATHGGLLSETLPAASAGAPRPQTRHTYAQRHAWISNGAGGYVQAATPVWVRTETSTCRTSAATGNPAAPCVAGALDEVRTVYDYGPNSGPNNLLLRGQMVTAETQGALMTLRTCFGYDVQGRRISETQPNANLGSCP
jgi:hypothetical protein